MAKTINEKLEAAKLERAQAEARIKELEQQLKAQERKDRNHRFCKRGGLMEKMLPDLAVLTDEQFQTFVDKTLLTGFAEKILRGLVPATPAPITAPESGADTGQCDENTAPKPAQTSATPIGADESKTGDAARVAS